MYKLRLRGHHIGLLNGLKGKDPSEIDNNHRGMEEMYGAECTSRYLNLAKKIDDNTLFEVVRGNDDVCAMSCPFAQYCEVGDYRIMNELADHTNFRSEKERKNFLEGTPETADIGCNYVFGLKIGQTYSFGDLKKIRKFPGKKLMDRLKLEYNKK